MGGDIALPNHRSPIHPLASKPIKMTLQPVVALVSLLMLWSIKRASSFVVLSAPPGRRAAVLSIPRIHIESSACFDRTKAAAAETTALEETSTATPTPTWYDAKVLSTEKACPSGKSLFWKVQVSETLPPSSIESTPPPPFEYTDPGQFLQLRRKPDQNDNDGDDDDDADEDDTTDPIFLAMCAPPSFDSPNTLSFLVKTTPNLPWLTEVCAGSTVQVTQAQGQGLASTVSKVLEDAVALATAAAPAAINEADEVQVAGTTDISPESADDGWGGIDHLLLVASGSGIAPLMACIREGGGWLPQSVPFVTLYYGEWTMDDLCFQEELFPVNGGEADHKIYTLPCLSRQERDLTKGIWSGHVQNVMWSRGIVNPENTVALICGAEDMEKDVTQLLKRAGVDESRILKNH